MENEIIINNLGLVGYALKYFNIKNSYDYQDYFQEGTIGLIKAVKHFNSDSSFSFSTYAYKCIKNEICKYAKKESKYSNLISLNQIIYDDVESGDLIIDGAKDILDIVIENETNEELNSIVNEYLNDIEKKIVDMYYFNNTNQNDIANLLNIKQYKVSRINFRLLKKLKDKMTIR